MCYGFHAQYIKTILANCVDSTQVGQTNFVIFQAQTGETGYEYTRAGSACGLNVVSPRREIFLAM